MRDIIGRNEKFDFFTSNSKGCIIKKEEVKMISDVVTVGKVEREIVTRWINKCPIKRAEEAKFMSQVHDALDEVTYSYKVAWGEEYSVNETILFIAYNIAIGRFELEDVIGKHWTMRAFVRQLWK